MEIPFCASKQPRIVSRETLPAVDAREHGVPVADTVRLIDEGINGLKPLGRETHLTTGAEAPWLAVG
jgi:hypothetical protein